MKLRRLFFFSALLGLCACSAQTATPAPATLDAGVLFAGPLDALAPFRHGNGYTYIIAAGDEDERRVESRCSVAGNRVFLTVTQAGEVLARTEMITDADALYVVSEVSPQHDVAFTYDPPLRVLETPLRTGVQRTQSKLRAWRPSDGGTIGDGVVDLAWSAHLAPEEMTDASFEVRTVKKLVMTNGYETRIQSKRWLTVGVGEIGSTGTAGDGRFERRELECAQIGERALGPCGEPIIGARP